MSKSNGSSSTMRPSTQDTIALSDAIEERFLNLCGTYFRQKGEKLQIPLTLKQDMLRWRQVVVRHRRGDFRNSQNELQSIRTFAQWTLDMNCELRCQPKRLLTWRD
jgi:hypothetical protein